MKFFLYLLCICCIQPAFAQFDFNFAIVNDKDGWVNVRNNDKSILEQLKNNKLVYVFPPDFGDKPWSFVAYEKNSEAEEGYIHESRLRNVSTLKKVPCIKKQSLCYTFEDDIYSIKIYIEPFNLTNKTLQYSDEGSWLEYIDGKYIWGVDGGIPKHQYKDISIKKNGKNIPFPKKALENLFEPTLDYIEIYYNKKTNILYITSSNSDGAGSYFAGWTIEDDKYKERLVSHGF